MNTDHQFAQKIARALDQGVRDISPQAAARLHAARTLSLSHQRQPVAMFSLAGVGQWISDWRSGIRTSMVVLALVAGVAGSLYWDAYVQSSENEEVDSILLADELPFDAFLDDGFQLWVDSSESSSY